MIKASAIVINNIEHKHYKNKYCMRALILYILVFLALFQRQQKYITKKFQLSTVEKQLEQTDEETPDLLYVNLYGASKDSSAQIRVHILVMSSTQELAEKV